jgi:hypothetical protein
MKLARVGRRSEWAELQGSGFGPIAVATSRLARNPRRDDSRMQAGAHSRQRRLKLEPTAKVTYEDRASSSTYGHRVGRGRRRSYRIGTLGQHPPNRTTTGLWSTCRMNLFSVTRIGLPGMHRDSFCARTAWLGNVCDILGRWTTGRSLRLQILMVPIASSIDHPYRIGMNPPRDRP